MFSLLSGFWQYFFTKPNIHVLIIGLDNAGKTTILEKIKAKYGNTPGLPPERIPPTVGMNLAKLTYRGTKIIIWDLGGQSKMRKIWEKYYGEANTVIYVVDSTDIPRLQEAKLAFDAVCDNDYLSKIPIITFANKQDLSGAVSVSDLSLTFYSRQENGERHIFPMSALTGQGIEEAIPYVVHQAVQNARLKRN